MQKCKSKGTACGQSARGSRSGSAHSWHGARSTGHSKRRSAWPRYGGAVVWDSKRLGPANTADLQRSSRMLHAANKPDQGKGEATSKPAPSGNGPKTIVRKQPPKK